MEGVTTKDYYPGLDALRVFAMICVVLLHLAGNSPYKIDGYVYNTVIMGFGNFVLLFMMISCFSCCCGYYEKIKDGTFSTADFYRKRFIRIWPFFAMLCVIDFVLAPSEKAAYEVFANLTLCFGFLNAEISVIGVGWYLGIAFIFYMAFPLICWILQNKCRAWVAFFAAYGLAIACTRYFQVGNHNFCRFAVYFLTGGLIYLYRDILRRISEKFGALLLLLCLGFAIAWYTLGNYNIFKIALFSMMLIYALKNGRGGVFLTRLCTF